MALVSGGLWLDSLSRMLLRHYAIIYLFVRALGDLERTAAETTACSPIQDQLSRLVMILSPFPGLLSIYEAYHVSFFLYFRREKLI